MPAAYAGTLLNHRVSPAVLLLAFAVVILVAAVAMLLDDPPPDDRPGRRGSRSATVGGDASVAVAIRPDTERRAGLQAAGKIVLCGLVSGFLTGLLGVGGGFLVVPALVVVLRAPMVLAIGTSLLVIVLNSIAALAGRLGEMPVDWAVVGPFTIAAVVGTLLGKRVADALSGVALTRAFAGMLVLVGGFVAVESTLSLLGTG